MCVILACDSKTGKPTKQMLKDAELMNGDGGSIAWIHKDKVRWEKGIKAKDIYKIVKKVKLPFIIHFRIATHGGVNKPLCHPFPITEKVELNLSGKTDRVLFHNGIWSEYDEYALKAVITHKLRFLSGKISDSRTMAWLVFHFGKNILNLMGEGNKMALLTKNGIEYFGKGWVKVDKVYCSNDHFDTNFTYNDSDNIMGSEYESYGDYDNNMTEKKPENMLYDEMGEMSETWEKKDCEYNKGMDCYEAPDGDKLYDIQYLDRNEAENNKWKHAQDEMENNSPIGTLPAREMVNESEFESNEWENRQWFNKHKGRHNYNGGGFM